MPARYPVAILMSSLMRVSLHTPGHAIYVGSLTKTGSSPLAMQILLPEADLRCSQKRLSEILPRRAMIMERSARGRSSAESSATILKRVE